MLRRFILILLLTFVSAAPSQTLREQLRSAVQDKQMSAQEALILEARSVLAPDLLPLNLQGRERLPVKSATELSYRINAQRNHPVIAAEPILKAFLSRPVLQTSMVSPDGFFRIHYDTTGYKAVAAVDLNANGLPDYVDEIAAAFDTTYDVIVNQIGFKPPPGDNGRNGQEYDVYIRDLSGVYGWTNFEETIDGTDIWITYIEVDNDYRTTPTPGLDGARVTAAHEFFHAVQFGYSGRDENDDGTLDDVFLMEAASTWMEDVVYDDINDYYFYLNSFFRQDNKAFDSLYGIHPYGLCVWFHFLEIRTGGRGIVKSIWERLVEEPAMEAMSSALLQAGLSIEDELTLFRGWNYMTGPRALPGTYYPEGAYYPQVRLAGEFFFRGDTTFTSLVNYCTGRYYRFVNTAGDTAVIIPVHTDLLRSQPDNNVTIELVQGGSHSGFYAIGNKYNVRLNTEQLNFWGGAAVTVAAGEPVPALTTFAAGSNTASKFDKPMIYPNPFKPEEDYFLTLHLPFTAMRGSDYSIFTASGYCIYRHILENDQKILRWDGKDEKGNDIPSGVYIVVVNSGEENPVRGKFVLVR